MACLDIELCNSVDAIGTRIDTVVTRLSTINDSIQQLNSNVSTLNNTTAFISQELIILCAGCILWIIVERILKFIYSSFI